jgi:hypothetical protein
MYLFQIFLTFLLFVSLYGANAFELFGKRDPAEEYNKLQEQRLEQQKKEDEQRKFFSDNEDKSKNKDVNWKFWERDEADEQKAFERKKMREQQKAERDKLKQLAKENKLLREQQKLKSDLQNNQVKLYDMNRKPTFREKVISKFSPAKQQRPGLVPTTGYGR